MQDVEAKPGNIITAVRAAAVNSLHYKPNVVLINAGTNDCRLSEDIPNAGNRMRSLIMETLLNAEDMQDTLIVLSTLIPSGRADIERHRNDVNDQYRDLVAILRDEGVSIVLADMDPLPEYNDPWIRFPNEFTSQTGVDDTHPNDEGYRVMARIWADAIEYAHSENLIPTPATVEGSLGKVCEKDYGNGIYAGSLTQKGSGLGDGIYYHESEAQGVLFSTRVGEDEEQDFFFARLVSRSRDDLLVSNKDSNTGVVTYDVYLNSG
jgi:lysophospholipase L1-like esterase